MDKVLITGANGYLGACVFKVLDNSGIWNAQKLNGRLEEIKPGTLDFDLVVHCAGALRHRKGEHTSTNEVGTKQLICGLTKKTKFIYISSKSIYGTTTDGICTEQTLPNPDDDYGQSKYMGELEIMQSGNPFIILRSSTLYGIGADNQGIAFPSMAIQQLLKGKDINLFSPDVLEEYLYVWDLATVISELIGIPDSWNNIYNISGPGTSLLSLIMTEKQVLEKYGVGTGKINFVPKRQGTKFYLDSSKLLNTIGADFYTPIEVIVERMVAFLKWK